MKLLTEFKTTEIVLIFSDLYQIFLNGNHQKILKEAESLIKSLIKNNKTVVLPTFNLFFPKTKITSFSTDHITTGYLNRYLVKKFKFKRTLRPMYNYAVIGPQSKSILSMKQTTAWGKDSVVGYLIKNKCLGVGLNIDPKKFNWLAIHYCEEKAKVPYRYYKKFNGYNNSIKKKVYEKMFVRDLDVLKIEDGRVLNTKLIKKKKIKTKKIMSFKVSFINLMDYSDEAEKLLSKNIYSLVKNEKRIT